MFKKCYLKCVNNVYIWHIFKVYNSNCYSGAKLNMINVTQEFFYRINDIVI